MTSRPTGTARRAIISTGNAEIDLRMGGGIPFGSLTLIEGQSDAGKSVLCQQLSWGTLNAGGRVAIYTTEATVRSLLRQMDSLGLNVLDFLLLGDLKVFALTTGHNMSSTQVFERLLESMKRQQSYDFLVMDSLTPFVTHASSGESIAFFEGCKEVVEAGRSVACVVHTHALEQNALIRIRPLCDAHLQLRLEDTGDRLVKVLEVAKIRGADKATGSVVAFDVEPGLGMNVVPISRAKA